LTKIIPAACVKADGDRAQGFYFGRPLPASELAASILADFQNAHAKPQPGPRIGMQVAK
jgi:hypothetical protein